ncbi:RNase H domain-containing protein [Trichonephila clavipes]|nr:RNase H domain-containing protein [Trichonephila clavipes]
MSGRGACAELPVHVNKQADLPAYLKQLALEKIGDITIDAVQVFTNDSRDDNCRSGSGIYIKSQDHILRIQRRNPDGCSVFRSELIAIDEALGSLASLPNGKEIWILSDSRKHHWYQCSRPGGSLAHGFTRQDQTLLARFRSGHIKSMQFSEGRKSFEMCMNCSSEPATPAHILECPGLTKQDLADVPLLVLDYLKVYDVRDLV